MNVQYKKGRAKGLECSNRQELIEISTRVERNIVAFEVEMRSANQPPPPRSTDPCLYMFENERVVLVPREEPRPRRPMAERLGGQGAKNCPNPRVDASNAPPPFVVVAVRVDPLAEDRTDKAVCARCTKPGHTITQCWKEHPARGHQGEEEDTKHGSPCSKEDACYHLA